MAEGISLEYIGTEHLTALSTLEGKCFSCPWSEESFSECLENDRYLFIGAFDKGNLVGYGGIITLFNEGDVANIAVDESYRGRGIGRAILSRLCDEARGRGVELLYLEVRESNTAARSLYDSFGFTVDGVRKNYYSRPTENAVLMTKKL